MKESGKKYLTMSILYYVSIVSLLMVTSPITIASKVGFYLCLASMAILFLIGTNVIRLSVRE